MMPRCPAGSRGKGWGVGGWEGVISEGLDGQRYPDVLLAVGGRGGGWGAGKG